jgi:serine/threonine protein kinase
LGCTPEYASPELLSQSTTIDIRSDIYSIGRIMHRLFGNKLKSIREKCLQQNPEDRYANADEILRALGRRTQVQRIFIPLLILLIILPTVFFLGFNLAPSAQTDTLVITQELDSTK